ncbi:hypothetical protein ACFQ0M_04525 [Kitasatospora aburaviensis]
MGTGDRRAREELAALRERAPGRFGVRVGDGCRLGPDDLGSPEHSGVDTVVVDSEAGGWDVGRLADGYRVLVEVTDLPAALAAVRSGAHGLVVRGCESGGRVGDLSTFVLLQQVLAAPGSTCRSGPAAASDRAPPPPRWRAERRVWSSTASWPCSRSPRSPTRPRPWCAAWTAPRPAWSTAAECCDAAEEANRPTRP